MDNINHADKPKIQFADKMKTYLNIIKGIH
jgi:hypothetical protein